MRMIKIDEVEENADAVAGGGVTLMLSTSGTRIPCRLGA